LRRLVLSFHALTTGNTIGYVAPARKISFVSPEGRDNLIRDDRRDEGRRRRMGLENRRFITVIGAAEHNLKNIAVEIPRNATTLVQEYT
jgi:hypothetical protein